MYSMSRKKRFAKGDIVYIKDSIHGHGFKIGKRVRIISVSEDDYYALYLNNRSAWYVTDEELSKKSLTIKK